MPDVVPGPDGRPTCEGVLRDGSRCRTRPAHGSLLCSFHERQEAELAEQAAPVVDAVAGEAGDVAGPPVGASTNVRLRLAADIAERYPAVWDSLSPALAAVKARSVSCSKCGARSMVEVEDWTARTNAVKLLLEQGYGKPAAPVGGSADSKVVERVARNRKRVEEMSDDELAELVAVGELRGEDPTFADLASQLGGDAGGAYDGAVGA